MNRIALIGCGAVAADGHLPTILRHPAFELAAVCDVRPAYAARLAREAGGVPTYEDWRELLNRERVDAVALALPPDVSPDVAVDCLNRGIAVLDEKPLAATVSEGRRVAAAVTQTGGVYQIGFVLRYGDWVQAVTHLALKIGTPSKIRVVVVDERLDRTDQKHLNRLQGFLANSSAMTHEGSHVIDYASRWNPSSWAGVMASARRTSDDFWGPNVWNAEIEHLDGSTLEVEIGWLLDEPSRCSASIHGPNGWLELNVGSGVGQWRIQAERGTLALPGLAPEWDRQYDVFASAVERGSAETSTIADGLRALEVTTAAENSARSGRRVVRTSLDVSGNDGGVEAGTG